VTLTYGDVGGAVCLQEAVEVLPGLGDPVDDLDEVFAAHVLMDLRLDQLPPQEAAQEAFDGLRVVGAQHPPAQGDGPRGQLKSILQMSGSFLKVHHRPEVVVQLQVGRRGDPLVHGADDIRAAGRPRPRQCHHRAAVVLSAVEENPLCIPHSPSVVLAVEEAVEDVSEGADVVQVVQDHHGGRLGVRVLGAALLRQAGQVLTQVLGQRASP